MLLLRLLAAAAPLFRRTRALPSSWTDTIEDVEGDGEAVEAPLLSVCPVINGISSAYIDGITRYSNTLDIAELRNLLPSLDASIPSHNVPQELAERNACNTFIIPNVLLASSTGIPEACGTTS